ncbi:MAG: hypothetical protein HKO92_02220 [Flavobacteriaceae bacterium]|nr:hypothetical protein [Flavobacteriaceae bacterium]
MTEENNNNYLQVAELMKKDLAKLETYETRKEITDFLKDQFVAKRLETSSKQEKLREITLNKLIERIEDGTIPVVTLLKILEVTNKGGELDFGSLLGGGGKGINLQINNNQQNNSESNQPAPVIDATATSSSPVKDLGFMLEAMQTISSEIPVDKAREMKEIIDVKKIEDDK